MEEKLKQLEERVRILEENQRLTIHSPIYSPPTTPVVPCNQLSQAHHHHHGMCCYKNPCTWSYSPQEHE